MSKYAIINNFYASKVWRDFRTGLIAERSIKNGCKCEHCGKLMVEPSKMIGHHAEELTPENVNDYSISLNSELVELICYECHNEEHKRFGYEKGKQVFIIYGCPLSGKTTYVRRYKGRGDIVIDIDQLYKAVTFLNDYDKPDRLLSNIKRVRNDLLDQIKVRYGKWQTAWVIMGGADKYRREKLAEDLGAELIYMECSKEEAMARLHVDEDRKYMKADYFKYIETWFERHAA